MEIILRKIYFYRKKINEYCTFSSEKGNWNFLNKIITYENRLFPITNDSIKNGSSQNIENKQNIKKQLIQSLLLNSLYISIIATSILNSSLFPLLSSIYSNI